MPSQIEVPLIPPPSFSKSPFKKGLGDKDFQGGGSSLKINSSGPPRRRIYQNQLNSSPIKLGVNNSDITYLESGDTTDENQTKNLLKNTHHTMSKTFTKNNPMHKSSQYFNIKYGADGSESMSHHSCYKFQVIKGNNANLVTKILSSK